ncbi:ThiF family adenylyltransferase [Actinocorallia lasiicapitis]
MAEVGADWQVTAYITPRGEGEETIGRLRELRARILFDGGRRPAFRREDGAHVDPQELDHGAIHFVGRRASGGPPLGYVRLSPPPNAPLFQTRAFLGDARYEALLRAENLTEGDVFEHSRLVVEHRARRLGLGVHLNAMAIAAAHALGARAMVGTSGTADGQDGFHARFGFHEIPGTRRYVEQYTEDVVILLHRAAQGAGEHTELVRRLRRLFPASVAPASASPPELGEAPGPAAREGWRPELIEGAAFERVEELRASGRVREVCDTLGEQLAELVTAREPGLARDPGLVAAAVARQLDGVPVERYGTWAWYPWSGRLVHVLPCEELRLVRTDRNRGKIDRVAQRRLLGKRIGIVGLSVGSSAAVTLALEGVGGAFRLADFDELGLSNLNRLRAGVHDLGVNKAVLAARQLYEIDPYLEIEIFPAGLNPENLDSFFAGGLDLLVEECDTPWVKIAAREKARALGVPVVMDANDRGLLDVERFDEEPGRPLLHGLLGDLTSDDLNDLTPSRRVELILAMVDESRISPQLAAAIPLIGRTLSSWPQLASGVALGGALCTEAARRILLGEDCPSGRYYTDLEATVSREKSTVA